MRLYHRSASGQKPPPLLPLAVKQNQRHRQTVAAHILKDLTMSLFSNVSERFARYQETRRTMRELSRLSDRDLADLGISRAAIPQLARTGKRF